LLAAVARDFFAGMTSSSSSSSDASSNCRQQTLEKVLKLAHQSL
jgi:hypothetical protein